MIAAYIIGGVLLIAGIIWGIWAFTSHVVAVYDYNIFNVPNLLMLFIMFIIWIVLIYMAGFTDIQVENLNYIISAAVTGVVLIIMFIRNLRHTSLPVAIGSLVLQIAATFIIIFIIAGFLFFRRQEE